MQASKDLIEGDKKKVGGEHQKNVYSEIHGAGGSEGTSE